MISDVLAAILNLCLNCRANQCNNPSPFCKECDDEADKTRLTQTIAASKADEEE